MQDLDFLVDLNESEESTIQGGRTDFLLITPFFNLTAQLSGSPFGGAVSGLLASLFNNPAFAVAPPPVGVGFLFSGFEGSTPPPAPFTFTPAGGGN